MHNQAISVYSAYSAAHNVYRFGTRIREPSLIISEV